MEGLERLLPLLLASGQQEAKLVALTQQALTAKGVGRREMCIGDGHRPERGTRHAGR